MRENNWGRDGEGRLFWRRRSVVKGLLRDMKSKRSWPCRVDGESIAGRRNSRGQRSEPAWLEIRKVMKQGGEGGRRSQALQCP